MGVALLAKKVRAARLGKQEVVSKAFFPLESDILHKQPLRSQLHR